MAELKEVYREDFNKVKKYIEKNAAKGKERTEALESLFAIYASAMEKEESIFTIHTNSSEEYAKEICEGLPEKKKTNVTKIAALAAISAAFIFAAVVLVMGMNPDYLLEKRGLSWVFNNPYCYIVEISENVQGAYIYFDDRYEPKYESLLKSEIYKTEEKITAEGFIKNSGIFADEIIIDENQKSVFIKMHAERTKDAFGKDQVISPVYPANKNSGTLEEYGDITHFESSGVTVKIDETVFKGAIREAYVEKNGDVVFTVKTELLSSGGTDVEKYMDEGNALELYFNSSYTIKWKEREDKNFFSFKNLSVKKEFFPEYDYLTLEKTTPDGMITLTFGAFVDKNGKIEDVDSWLNTRTEEEVTKKDSYSADAQVSEDGTHVVYPLEYQVGSGPVICENLIITTEDTKFSFDR